MARNIDVSAGQTSVGQQNIGASPVNRGGAVAGHGSAQASQMRAAAARTSAAGTDMFTGAIKSGTQAALDIHTGYSLANLEKEQSAIIEQQVKAWQDPVTADQLAIQAGTRATAEPLLWDQFGKAEGGSIVQELDGFAAESDALKRAYDQGMIQPSELRMRLHAVTREHISRNPSLYTELLEHAEKTLNISGIKGLKDVKPMEDVAAEQFKKYRDELVADLRKHNRGYEASRSYDPDYLAELNAKLNIYKAEKDEVDKLFTGEKVEATMDAQGAKEFAKSGKAASRLNGFNAGTTMEVTSIIQTHMGNPQAKMDALRQLASSREASLDQYLIDSNLDGQPIGETMRRSATSYLNAAIAAAEKANSMEDLTANLGAREQVASLTNKLAIRDNYNPEEIQLVGTFQESVVKWGLERDPERMQRNIETFQGLFDGAFTKSRDVKTLIDGYGDIPGDQGQFRGRNNAAAGNASLVLTGDFENFEKAMQGWAREKAKGTFTTAQHYKMMDDFAAIIEQQGRAGNIPRNNEAAMNGLFSNVNDYMGFITEAYQAEDKKGKVTTSELPGGGIRFDVAGNPSATQKLNQKYAAKYNRMAGVLATLTGVSRKEAFDVLNAGFGPAIGLQGAVGSQQGGNEPKEGRSSSIDEKIVRAESGGKADAKNPMSSATGVGQFIESTWIDVMNKHFPEVVRENPNRQDLLALRTDPDLSRRAVAALREDNQSVLESQGVPVNDTSVYLAHFLGAGKAAKLLKATPNSPVSKLLTEAEIKANERVLRGKSVQDVINWASRSMGRGS
jgi:hypothetical protein